MTKEMKDSGVEWIGEIPNSWDLSTIGAHYRQRNEKVSDLDFAPLSVTKNGIVPQLESAAKSSNHNDRKLVRKDDFVINSRSDRKMSCGIANEDGSVSLINIVLCSESISKEYTKYLLKNYSFAEEFYRWGTGIVADLWSTKWDRMKKIAIPVPTLEEQNKIASKLDELITKIETIISETQQSIEELKKYKQSLITETVTKGLDKNVVMKDSGFDKSVTLPKHWDINKVRNVFRMNKGLTITKENLQDDGISVISYGEIHSKYGFRFDPDKHEVKKVAESYMDLNESALLKQGDFIFADTSEDIQGSGNFTCFVGSQTCFAGYHTIVLKPILKMNFDFLAYMFESVAFRVQIQKKVQGIKVYSITQRILKPLTVWFPPAIEQQNIVEYLDDKVGKVNTLISEKQQVIQELEQYKKSLIYEYVTGKKEV